MVYKLFIRYSLSGLRFEYLRVSSKRDLYTFIGFLYSSSDEHIDRVDYIELGDNRVVSSVPYLVDFERWAYIHKL